MYTGSQFGCYFRLDLGKGTRTYITPKSKVKGETFRFNWQTPILLSPHNQDIVYFGSNKLHRSLNQGNEWSTISDDLTSGEKKGNVAYGTLTTISESPFKFGMIYVGSDDGHVNLTKDGGNSWQNISNSFPKNLWVSRVIASAHKKERVYVTLNGYRWDDFTSYVYMSDDYGVTWKNIGNTIPTSPVNVIKEDPENEHILYLGTDNGLYVTFDNGGAWHPFSNGFPNVAVHDLVIQKRDKDLVVGTHGRSIYRANISKLQSFNSYNSKATHLFEIETIRSSSRWGSTRWGTPFTPEVDISVFSNSAKKTKVSVYAGDVLVNSFSVNVNRGFTTSKYDVSFSKSGKRAFERANKKIKLKEAPNGVFYLPKGKYTVKVDNEEQTLEVK